MAPSAIIYIFEENSVKNRLPVCIGPDAVSPLVQYCRDHDLSHFAMIVDANTYRALGEAAESALRGQGWDVLTVMLEGDDIIADALIGRLAKETKA